MLYTVLLIMHVIAVILWIGGVAFVTTVIFPLLERTEGPLEKALLFQRVEHRFAAMVRWLIAIVGVSGLWLLSGKYGFGVLATLRGAGIVIMLVVWAFYTGVLLAERRMFSRLFEDPEKINMDQALKLINAMHWFLLLVSFSAVAAGVWFGHYP